MNIVFLLCALALPHNAQSDYFLFTKYIETTKPEYILVYIHPDEYLLNPNAECTPLMLGSPLLRIWAIKRSA